MKLRIDYSRQAQKFLDHNSTVLTVAQVDMLITKAMKKLLKMENTNIDVQALRGDRRGSYRIRTGKVRIIFSYQSGVVMVVAVVAIDFRGYK
ncbi:MAG: hypothetical protein BWK78_08945 [Thiotrichaceae bacterium IS1]|nr:MAG: hypothetical protein BWK78_08945 [Thiotrichaceae bacterium IS1]